MFKAPYAISSLIKKYGVEITHHPRPTADASAPWKATTVVTPTKGEETHTAVMKGLIQHVRADASDRLPEGGVKAIMVLMVDQADKMPLPGDELAHANITWRANTVIPLSAAAMPKFRGSNAKLVEVVVTSRGNPNE